MRVLPDWLSRYPRQHLSDDVVAGLVVGILVIPQSLGYALLAGLPPVYGLYAAILPVLAYAWVGSSNTQAVGPVAITSMMTAQALLPIVSPQEVSSYAAYAGLLAVLSGLILGLAGVLRLGWLTQLMSRGVVAGFITGAALLIMVSQSKYLLGVSFDSQTLLTTFQTLPAQLPHTHQLTLLMGVLTLLFLVWAKRQLNTLLLHLGLSTRAASLLSRMAPLLSVAVSTLLCGDLALDQAGVAIIGQIPAGLPTLGLPALPTPQTLINLIPTATLIALIGFISSASVAQEFALRRRESFDANRELIGLGVANLAGALMKGFPVSGGFSRTAVNIEAGAQTPLAGVISALVMVLVLLALTSWFYFLPYAVLGAGIIAAVTNLVDLNTLKQAWQYDRSDAWAYLITASGVLLFGLQVGLIAGVLLSFAAILYRSSQPHCAVVGQYGSQGHFRNIERYDVKTWPNLLLFRIDERLFFGNTRSVQEHLNQALASRPEVQHVVLILSAVNSIDLSAQLMLEELSRNLQARQITLHLAEIKGPVMDAIQDTPAIKHLNGQVFLSTLDAVNQLKPRLSDPEYHL